MLMDQMTLVSGATTLVASGSSFPTSPVIGTEFYKTTSPIGLHIYDGDSWEISAGGGGTPSNVTISTLDPSGGVDGDIWYKI